jgi:hypothetical protein
VRIRAGTHVPAPAPRISPPRSTQVGPQDVPVSAMEHDPCAVGGRPGLTRRSPLPCRDKTSSAFNKPVGSLHMAALMGARSRRVSLAGDRPAGRNLSLPQIVKIDEAMTTPPPPPPPGPAGPAEAAGAHLLRQRRIQPGQAGAGPARSERGQLARRDRRPAQGAPAPAARRRQQAHLPLPVQGGQRPE